MEQSCWSTIICSQAILEKHSNLLRRILGGALISFPAYTHAQALILALSMQQNREAMEIKSKRDAFNYQICLNMFTDTFPDLKSKVTKAKDQFHTFQNFKLV